MNKTVTKKTYDTYKDSGIEWIGEIPSIKNLLRNKYFLKYIKGKNPEKLNSEGDGIPYVGASELDNLTGMVNYENYTEQLELPKCTNSNVLVLWDGARAGLIGKNHCGAISSTVVKLEPDFNNINENYLFYYLKGFEKFLYDKVNGTTIPHMNRDYIEEIKWIDFTIDEQQAIADYLDKKCGEIDKVVEVEKSVIEKLKEYKQSIITEAVTKGLDKSVPLKDSGIEWIGKIPQHWEIARIKYNYYLKGRIGWQGLKASEFLDEGAYLITGTDFCNGRVNWDTCYHISEERYNEAPEIHVQIDDLLITKDGTVGKVAYIDNKPEKVSLNSHLLIIRPNNKNYKNKFLYWVIQSEIFEKYYQLSQNGTIMASLSQEKISNFSFALPDPVDQIKIAGYLDQKCSEIDKAIADKEQLIEKFTEYKKSLIYECVTGKRKVVA